MFALAGPSRRASFKPAQQARRAAARGALERAGEAKRDLMSLFQRRQRYKIVLNGASTEVLRPFCGIVKFIKFLTLCESKV